MLAVNPFAPVAVLIVIGYVPAEALAPVVDATVAKLAPVTVCPPNNPMDEAIDKEPKGCVINEAWSLAVTVNGAGVMFAGAVNVAPAIE